MLRGLCYECFSRRRLQRYNRNRNSARVEGSRSTVWERLLGNARVRARAEHPCVPSAVRSGEIYVPQHCRYGQYCLHLDCFMLNLFDTQRQGSYFSFGRW